MPVIKPTCANTSAGARASMSLPSSFYSSRSPLGTEGASHPFSFLYVRSNQLSETDKWDVFLPTPKVAVIFSSFNKRNNSV